MSIDYGAPEHRRTKKDLKRKRKQRAYKRGGRFRVSGIKEKEKK